MAGRADPLMQRVVYYVLDDTKMPCEWMVVQTKKAVNVLLRASCCDQVKEEATQEAMSLTS